MDKTARAELIAALVTDKFTIFKDGDEPILEAASDARLEDFRGAAEKAKAAASDFTRVETELRNVGARLKVAEDRIKASEQELSEEEFVKRAPSKIKALIEAQAAEEAAYRASIISQLKDLGANTEDELKARSTEELRTLAAYARIDVRASDFSGRTLPIDRTLADRNSYAPPDPYAAGLKALRETTKH